MKKKVIGVIHQPNYLPWVGYFEQIIYSDIFIFFDNVQFPRRSWCNRNRIMNNGAPCLLSVPTTNASREELIKDIKIDNRESWITNHLKSIEYSYKKSPYFSEVFPFIQKILMKKYKYLVDLDIDIIKSICSYLEIKTNFYKASQKEYIKTRTELLRDICKDYKITHYYTSKGAKDYLDREISILTNAGIEVEYQNYKPVEYKQLGTNEFVPFISIMDILMNEPKEKVPKFIKAGAVH